MPSGATSHGPYNGLEVKNTALILCEKQEELQAYGTSWGMHVPIATCTEAADLCRADKSCGHAITINVLPDYVLLEIFDSCRKDHDPRHLPFIPAWRWHVLAHVCRRWRQIVLESPRRLDLQIFCTNGTPVRENLDIWPPFPISIQYRDTTKTLDKDSLFAALEHPGRICHIELCQIGQHLSEVATVIQEPLPALEHLTLDFDFWREGGETPTLPIGFLGGFAPRLRYMRLNGIHFPTLPTLLSSTSNLVDLYLNDIPEDDRTSPEAMVLCLAALTKLKFLQIGLQSFLPASEFDGIPLPPVTRTVLPALTCFHFQGNNVYLEEFVSRIDSPQLNSISINFFNGLNVIYFDYFNFTLDAGVAQLFMFVDRSEAFEKTLIKDLDVIFANSWMAFETYPRLESHPDWHLIGASTYRLVIHKNIQSIAEMFSQPSKMLSHVIHLKLSCDPDEVYHLRDELQFLLCKFTTVRTLRISKEFARQVALELEDIAGEMVAQVLPVLDFIYLDDQPMSCVEKFLAARQSSGHPVTIVETEVEIDDIMEYYY